MLQPELLKGGDIIDKSTGATVRIEDLRSAVVAFGPGIGMVADVELGRVQFGVRDYLLLPNAFVQARTLFRTVKEEIAGTK